MQRVNSWRLLAMATSVVLLATPCAVIATEPPKTSEKSATKGTKSDTALRPLQAAGSRVVMDLPKAFQTAPRFVGFFDEKREISFVISDMPAEAFDKMSEGFTSALLKERGFLDPRDGTLERQDRYLYRRFAQSSPNGLVQKFVMIFATAEATGMVSGNVPTQLLSSGAVTEREIKTMLASARLVSAKAELPLVATLGDTASLKLSLTYGQTQIWTVDGKTGEQGTLSPAIILAASVSYDAVAKPAQIAAASLSSLAGHRNIALVGRATVTTIGAHKGIELTALADADKTGELRALYQFLIPQASGGYVRFIGIAPRADKDLWFVSFRQSIKSLKLKD